MSDNDDNDDNDDSDTLLEHNLDDSISVNETTSLRQKLLSAQILGYYYHHYNDYHH
jgi:hypothetical protein